MSCPFPCRGCLVAGRCPNGALPATGIPAPPRPAPEPPRAPRRAVAATYPRDLPRALPLVCGHSTTTEAAVFFSVWAPREGESAGQQWCETCRKWVSLKPPASRPIPAEPMF